MFAHRVMQFAPVAWLLWTIVPVSGYASDIQTNTVTGSNTFTDTNTVSNTQTNTQTRTCTINGVPVDCDTGQPLPNVPPLWSLCPERQYEYIYGLHCAHRIQQLRYKAVKIQHAYGGAGFNGGETLRAAYRLNDNSAVVGEAITSSGEVHAVQVNIGPQYPEHHYFSDLGRVGLQSSARAISNEHTVVGHVQLMSSSPRSVEAIWHSQIAFHTPMQGFGGLQGVATDLARNSMYTEFASGYTAWPRSSGGDGKFHGFVWSFDGQRQVMERIGELGQITRANAINDSKTAVGHMQENGVAQAYQWHGGVLRELPDFGDFQSVAWNINNNLSSKIVGFATDARDVRHAVVWQNGAMERLPSLNDSVRSAAYAITDGGDIVGQSQGKAVLWRDGRVYNLNELLDNSVDVRLLRAIDINRAGRVLVQSTGGYYLLVPSETL